GAVEDLAVPLLDGGDARGQNERLAPDQAHGGEADDGLASAAGQDDDAAAAAHVAAGVEDLAGLALVVADDEGQPVARDLAQAHRERGALGVAGQVLGGVADVDQGLLEDAAKGRFDVETDLVEALAEIAADFWLPRQLFQQRQVVADQPKAGRLAVEALEPN